MKHSMRRQLMALLAGMILFALVLIGIVNYCFLGTFYTSMKEKSLLKTYDMLNAYMLSEAASGTEDAEDAEDAEEAEEADGEAPYVEKRHGGRDTEEEVFSYEIHQVAVQDNIRILVTDVDFTDLRSTGRESRSDALRLFGYFTGYYRGTVVVRSQTSTYVIQETEDEDISTEYLEMWGQLDSGDWFLLRTPLESIATTARLSNIFYAIVGLVVILISMILVWFFSRRFTEPITQLTDLSMRMANLDFEARYTGEADSEIGQLGRNFNRMSDELETTISELKSAKAELMQDNERKTQGDEMRKEFLNSVSHELKTPIALIQGYAEGLKDDIASDPESRDFYLEVIMDEANKMNGMVRKLLTLNQLEFGNEQVAMERFDLRQLIQGVVSGMQILIGEKKADVSFPLDHPVYVWGDEFQIEEVVTNYLSNALNHLDYDRRIEIRVGEEDGIVTTTVFNTGDPIPEKDLDRVFEKFYKVDKARTREYGGSGIGLSIVKAIMDRHHGSCGVRNYENGVAFWFTLEGKDALC